MSSRDIVLGRIREALGRAAGPVPPTVVPDRAADAKEGGAGAAAADVDAPPLPMPAEIPRDYQRVGQHAPGSAAVLDLLVDRLVDYRAGVQVVDAGGLVAAVDRALGPARSFVVPADLTTDLGEDCALSGRTRHTDSVLAPLSAAELDGIDAVVTEATVAIALSGTIVLDGGPGQGRRAITLVPDRHVVVVRARQVVETVPEALARLDPVRPLTMIAGPSATSDIELTRVEGVHGPRTLEVVLVLDR